MSTQAKPMKNLSLGDRFAELSVLLLTLVALVLGWVLKSSVENRGEAFSNENITAETPAGWLTMKPEGNEVLHVTDRTASGYGTTYMIEVQAVPADVLPGQIVGLLTLNRGNDLTGYRVLNQQEVLVDGRNATEVDYVYVESDANLSRSTFPVVVHGRDYIFINGDQAIIVTYRADLAVFDTDLGRFKRFLTSVNY